MDEILIIVNQDTPIVFQNDGYPAHNIATIGEYLVNVSPYSWIGRYGFLE